MKEKLWDLWSLAVFRPYLLGRRFKAVTDNKALLALFKKDPGHRMIRWVLSLQQYDVEYHYRVGSKHGDADGCSRAFSVPSWVSFEKGDNIESLYNLEPAKTKELPSVRNPFSSDATLRHNYFREHYHNLVSANLATIAECDGNGNGSDLNVDLPSLPEHRGAEGRQTSKINNSKMLSGYRRNIHRR